MSDVIMKNEEEPKKNKRGRKPKSEMCVNLSNADNTNPKNNINVKELKNKSTKSISKRNIYNINDKIEHSVEEDDENIIMKLNINSVSSAELIESSMCINNSMMLNGYVDDLRITKGVARTITTPAAQFPDY